jgi:Protein of unknown function (DUF775)
MDVDSSLTGGLGPFGQQQQQQHFEQPTIPIAVAQPQQPLVGMIVPGGPVRTDFVPADATGTRFTLTLNAPGDLPWPVRSVNELVFFVPNISLLQPNTGLLIYWQLRLSNGQESGFELLGALWGPTKPSDVFRTGWAEHEQFVSLEQQTGGGTTSALASIVFGVSVEPLSTIQNVTGLDGNAMSQPWGAVGSGGNVSSGGGRGGAASPFGMTDSHDNNSTTNNRPMVAHKIAEDLYNFMMSFDTGGATGNQTMVVPANIFDRWWKRFEAKVKRDPNFFLKDSN